ncbi:MAG: TadE/TadG family type IV pilus assembly protein [Terracidiphilus sp.]
MKRLNCSSVRRFLRDELGQSAAVLMVSVSTVMGLAGMSIETGHIYYAYRLLQASTNAAALAGAYQMPNTTNAGTAVTKYSAQTGDLNATSLLTSVVATPTYQCLSTISNNFNVPCETSTGATGGYNAVKVVQTAAVPLWFGGLVGYKSVNIAAAATAAMRGGTNTPWNIAIIMDTTASMNDEDSGLQCNNTQINCAIAGLQVLLNDLYPCQLNQTCTASSGVTPVDSVSLFAFPAMTSGTVSKDYVCNTSDPTIVAYTIPNTSPAYTSGAPASNLMLPSGDTYQILPFVYNYEANDNSATLNQAAPLVIAAGDSGVSGCSGLQAPGGEGTYYAQVIYAAQATLATQQASYPGSKNAIILLSDGDATACASNANTSAGACDSKSQIVATEGTLNGTGTHTTNPSGYESYTYPSALGECGQAVLAAQYAATQGTAVYTIGYGAETSGGCLSDATYSTTVTTNGGSWKPGDQPCAALAAMASAQINFYSDDGSGCQATAPTNQSITALTAIFRAITNNMTTPRLIPNGSS